ncbi:MAG: GNAT family N-acetyltransferase [Phycisphaerae bacterium]|nr:GNAT family N-acetyltransferase [Phycisphaerae bacterium]
MTAADIRHFTSGDIGFALVQTGREGWDATAELFRTTLELEPQGAFIAEADRRAVGMITTLRHDETAWIGNLIVVPEYRGRGVGAMLMERAMEHQTGRGVRTLRLEADPAGIPLYRRLGFVDEFVSPRFFRPGAAVTSIGPTPRRIDSPTSGCPEAVKRLFASDLEAVVAFDGPFFGDDRSSLLSKLLASAPEAWKVESDDVLRGYLITQPSTLGVRIGPCVAWDAATADLLLETAIDAFGTQAIVAAVPESNLAAIELLARRGFVQRPPCLRMVWGEPGAAVDVHHIFAISNGAMG